MDLVAEGLGGGRHHDRSTRGHYWQGSWSGGVLRGRRVGKVVDSMRHGVPRGLYGSPLCSCVWGPEDISARTLRCGRRSC